MCCKSTSWLNCDDMIARKLAKSRCGVIFTLCVSIVISFLLIALSSWQTQNLNEGNFNGSDSAWDKFCDNNFIGYISPFAFNNVNDSNEINTCAWRPRNIAFRLTMVCITLISIGYTLFMIFKPEFNRFWWLVIITHLINTFFMFVVFVLDCDGLNTGYNTCLSEFKVNDDSGKIITGSDECFITPFVWTCMADIGLVISQFIVYRVCRYYDFDGALTTESSGAKKRRQSNFDEDFNSAMSKGSNTNNNQTNEAVPMPQVSAKEQAAFAGLDTSYQVNNNTNANPTASPANTGPPPAPAPAAATNNVVGPPPALFGQQDNAYNDAQDAQDEDNPFEDYV